MTFINVGDFASRHCRPAPLLTVILAVVLMANAGRAATFTVNSTLHGTDSNPATTTLVEAIQLANTAGGSNTIVLPSGSNFIADDTIFIDSAENSGRTFYPRITTTITINGNGSILDGTGKNARFFAVDGTGALTITDLTLIGGKAKGGNGGVGNFMGGGGGAGMGGGFFVNGATASLTLKRCMLRGCSATGGACQVSGIVGGNGGGGGGMGGNGADNGGGGGPRTDASNTTGGDGIGGNTGANNGGFGGGGGGAVMDGGVAGNGGFGGGGGGIWYDSNNSTHGSGPGTGGFGGGGGGTFNPGGTGTGGAGGAFGGVGGRYTVNGSSQGGGGAALGGAIFNYQGSVTLENVFLYGNSVIGGNGAANEGPAGAGSGAGGAIFNYDGTVLLRHVTAYTNSVATGSTTPGVATGGALYNYDAPGGATPSVTIYNSILANSAYVNATGVDVVNSGSGTITVSGAANSSLIRTTSGTISGTFKTVDPQLSVLCRYSSHDGILPFVGSPIIDAGDAANSVATDGFGFARPQGAGVDIGASERIFQTNVSFTAGSLLLSDINADAVYVVDPVTGNRQILSKLNVFGTGPNIGNSRGIAISAALDIYIVDTLLQAVVKINPTNGNRTIISIGADDATPAGVNGGAAVGTGFSFTTPSGITIRPDGKLLVTDTGAITGQYSDGIFVVDPVTGNRTILSSDTVPNGNNIENTPTSIIYHDTLGILVASQETGTADTVMKIDGTNGTRTVFSSATVPDANNIFSNPAGMAEDTDGSILLVEQNTTPLANRQLLRLNKTTGARTVVSNFSTNDTYEGVVVASSGVYVTKTATADTLYSVNTTTGVITPVANNTIGDGPLFGSFSFTSGIGIGFNLGVAAVPFVVSAGTPAISVQQAGSILTNGTSSVAFGTVSLGGGTAAKIFAVTNSGTATLNLTNLPITGANAGDFAVSGITLPATLATGAGTTFTVTFTPSASGARSASLQITNNVAGGNPFVVSLSGAGNTAPILSLPTSPVIAEATGASGAVVAFTVTANDAEDGTLTPTVVPASGSLFALGTNTVTASVVDTGGTHVTNTFLVVVRDTTKPVLTVSTNIVVTATSSAGAVVNFSVSATDLVDGSVTPSSLPASGSTFAHGLTTVTVIASDAHGNSATNTFQVTVLNAAPVVGVLTNRSVNVGTVIGFTATATDVDANALTFSLLNPPAFASISSGGVFAWRPHVLQAGGTNTLTVVVTDNGTPNLSATNSFTVIVTTNGLPVVLTQTIYTKANHDFSFTVNGPLGPDYVIMISSNLFDWSDLGTNLFPSVPFQYTHSAAATNNYRFYRVRLQP